MNGHVVLANAQLRAPAEVATYVSLGLSRVSEARFDTEIIQNPFFLIFISLIKNLIRKVQSV